MKHKGKKANINLRFNILIVVTYIFGIILIIQLFNLQIINGEKYKEQSNTRLTRETTLEAARGAIVDRTGVELVNSKMEFSLEMYRSKVDIETLNESILNMVEVLEKHECRYIDLFPISIEPFEFKISGEVLSSWKKSNGFNEEISAEEAFYEFKDKYKIINSDIYEIRKIATIRYLIVQNGYSSTRAVNISNSITREAVAEFSESSDRFAGINIVVNPVREYTSRHSCISYLRICWQDK